MVKNHKNNFDLNTDEELKFLNCNSELFDLNDKIDIQILHIIQPLVQKKSNDM